MPVVIPLSSTNKPNPPDPGTPSSAYQLVNHDDTNFNDNDIDSNITAEPIYRPRSDSRFRNATYILSVCLVVLLASNLYLSLPYSFHSAIFGSPSESCPCAPGKVPQYFQTSPELWAGPTATGRPAFMAQTRVIDPTATYVPNEPLQTAIPIEGMGQYNDSIFRMMGYLSPYSPSPGFGVDEYPIPQDAEIVQVQMLSRHGSRYPTTGSDVEKLGQRIANVSGNFNPKGSLAFLKDWKYQLGSEILVPKGRQELFDSGVLHSYMYGKLYNPSSKLIVRTTVRLIHQCIEVYHVNI